MSWRVSPVLGVPDVRKAAVYYRDALEIVVEDLAGHRLTFGEIGAS